MDQWFISTRSTTIPTYFYRCQTCQDLREDEARMTTYETHSPPCEQEGCEGVCKYEWVPTVPYVNFKDGPSGSWPSKGERFKKYRAEQSEKAAKRTIDRYGNYNNLVPNFDGKETEDWREARHLAVKEIGKEAAASYDTHIKKEEAKKP